MGTTPQIESLIDHWDALQVGIPSGWRTAVCAVRCYLIMSRLRCTTILNRPSAAITA